MSHVVAVWLEDLHELCWGRQGEGLGAGGVTHAEGQAQAAHHDIITVNNHSDILLHLLLSINVA